MLLVTPSRLWQPATRRAPDLTASTDCSVLGRGAGALRFAGAPTGTRRQPRGEMVTPKV